MAKSDENKNLSSFSKGIEGGAGIVSLIHEYEGGNDEAYSKLKGFVQSLINEEIGADVHPQSVINTAKELAGVQFGDKIYKNLTDFVDFTIKNNKPGTILKDLLPGLNELAKKAGFEEFQDTKYQTLNSLMDQISKGKLDKNKAYDIAEKQYLADLDKFIKYKEENQKDADLSDLKENKEKLAKIIGEFWSENRDTGFGKNYFLNNVNETEIKPYLAEKRQEISNYAKDISEKAKNTNYSTSFKGLNNMVNFITDYLEKQKTAKELMKEYGEFGPYLINSED